MLISQQKRKENRKSFCVCVYVFAMDTINEIKRQLTEYDEAALSAAICKDDFAQAKLLLAMIERETRAGNTGGEVYRGAVDVLEMTAIGSRQQGAFMRALGEADVLGRWLYPALVLCRQRGEEEEETLCGVLNFLQLFCGTPGSALPPAVVARLGHNLVKVLAAIALEHEDDPQAEDTGLPPLCRGALLALAAVNWQVNPEGAAPAEDNGVFRGLLLLLLSEHPQARAREGALGQLIVKFYNRCLGSAAPWPRIIGHLLNTLLAAPHVCAQIVYQTDLGVLVEVMGRGLEDFDLEAPDAARRGIVATLAIVVADPLNRAHVRAQTPHLLQVLRWLAETSPDEELVGSVKGIITILSDDLMI